ncbi:MAG: tautomerase family protein [Actinobacteria bacterium]|nr:tautomerase family protein [Actinomycetota bacterium]
MPFVNLRINEELLTADKEGALLEALTDAVVSVYGEDLRRFTWVIVDPVPPRRWAVGGRAIPSREAAP